MNSLLFCFFVLWMELTIVHNNAETLPSPRPAVNTTETLNRPEFVQEPDEFYYAVKGKPVTITCRALNAVQIFIKCAGQWIEPSQHRSQEIIDPVSDVHYLETNADIIKEEVEEHLGSEGYFCECHALGGNTGSLGSNLPLTVRSRRGKFVVAYLRKRFESEPINAIIEAGSATQLQCLPPAGLPVPEVFWLRDGELVDVQKEINFIISNEGSLIINQARLIDSGNYTCGAQNVAGRRFSESSTLIVYVNGGWSSWNHWSECSVRCAKGLQRRNRLCNNPSPLNGGAPCLGEAVQRILCNTICQIDGFWSTWSSWSTCSSDCKHHRRRLCDSPAPDNGGQHCSGGDLDTANCTGAMCKDGYENYDDSLNSANDQLLINEDVTKNHLAMFVGIVVAFLLFIAIATGIICFLRRLKKHPPGMTLTPDLTKIVVLIPKKTTQNDSPNSSSDKTTSDSMMSTQKLLTCDGHHAATDFSLSQNQSTSVSDMEHSVAISCQLPNNLDLEAFVWTTVKSDGGRITLPNSGVSLTIPEGAIPEGQRSEMYLAVSRDDKDRPKLTDVQTMLSAVIVCGPPTIKLKKTVILTFPHCASIKQGQWKLSVYASDSPYEEPPTWNCICTMGQETINTSVYVQTDLTQCHIMTDSFTKYTLIGEPCMEHKAVKILRLAVFAPVVFSSCTDYNLRVYFVEDTQDALEGALLVEQRLGGYLLEQPQQILFQFGGANLCLAIEDLGPGWRFKMQANYQEIPFRHIWNGTQNGLHCSFSFEHVDRSENVLTCSIHVFQTGFLNNRKILRVTHTLNENLLSSPSVYRLPHQRITMVTSTGYVNLDQPSKVFRLPSHIKKKLSHILDPPNSCGNDWRMLAQRLNVDRYINYFAIKFSPTENILDLWESRHREDSAITDLMNSLRVMGRMDASSLIEKELGIRSWL